MAHFTQLDENNVVLQTIVIDNAELLDENGIEQEELGINFCKQCYKSPTVWKQTSYNSNFRYNYASIGFTYDESADAFYAPKPFDSWTLSTSDYKWYPPITKPESNPEGEEGYWSWDEISYQNDNTKGWFFINLKYISMANYEIFA